MSSLQSYPSPPVDNRPGIRFDRRIDIESFSLIARDGHEASFFWKRVSWDFLLRVVDGLVEVRFDNPLCPLDVELTFLDSRKFVLWKAQQKGGGGERVILGPLSEDILEHLRGTGGHLLLSFLFLKPHQNYPMSPFPALEDPPSSIEPEMASVTETNPGGRCSWKNLGVSIQCSGAISFPHADDQNQLQPPSSIEPETALFTEANPGYRPSWPNWALPQYPGAIGFPLADEQNQLQPEYASFTTSLDVYPAVRRRRLLRPNYGHPFPYLKPRRPPSAQLISAMEKLSIRREEPRNPPSSNEPEDGFNDYLAIRRRKLLPLSSFSLPRQQTSDRRIPTLKSLLIGREKLPNPSIEPEKASNDYSTNRSLLRLRLPRHFNRCPTSDQLIPAMEGLAIGQLEPPSSSEPVATPLSTTPLTNVEDIHYYAEFTMIKMRGWTWKKLGSGIGQSENDNP